MMQTLRFSNQLKGLGNMREVELVLLALEQQISSK